MAGRAAAESGSSSPEGRAWWAQLRRERAAKARQPIAGGTRPLAPDALKATHLRGCSSQPAEARAKVAANAAAASKQVSPVQGDGSAETEPSAAHHQQEWRRRRSSLLHATQQLLRRMSSTHQQHQQVGLEVAEHSHDTGRGLHSQHQHQGSVHSPASTSQGSTGQPGGSHSQSADQEAAAAAASQTPWRPPTCTSISTKPGISKSSSGLSRTLSLRGTGTLAHPSSSDESHTKALLEGGLIGRAMHASAAWHAMQQQLAQREQEQWQGHSLAAGRCGGVEVVTAGGAGEVPARKGAGGSMLLPLAEGDEEECEEGQAGDSGTAAGTADGTTESDSTELRDLIAAFGDAEVRRYLQEQLSALEGSVSTGSAAATAGTGAPVAEGGSWAGNDHMMAAWMVTRAPPDFPVRGYQAPPGRTACRLIAAKEMREYYQQQQQHKQGHHLRWLGLTTVQAGGSNSETAPMQPTANLGAAPLPQHKTLRGTVRKSILLTQVQGMAQQSKAMQWAKEHAEAVAQAAATQVALQQQQQAAATTAAAAAASKAAAAAKRIKQLGDQAGSGFAAVVQQARRQATAGAGGSSKAGSRRGSALPPLQLMKLTQQWQHNAAATIAAAGEHTAQQRREAAARQQLREQWQAVQQRLPY